MQIIKYDCTETQDRCSTGLLLKFFFFYNYKLNSSISISVELKKFTAKNNLENWNSDSVQIFLIV